MKIIVLALSGIAMTITLSKQIRTRIQFELDKKRREEKMENARKNMADLQNQIDAIKKIKNRFKSNLRHKTHKIGIKIKFQKFGKNQKIIKTY